MNSPESPLNNLRIAFIPPRFYEGIVGGAETLVGDIASLCSELGAHVEIWTTCARDNRSWENSFEVGEDRFNDNICIKRFLVDDRDLEKWIPRQIQLNEGIPLELEDQFIWMEESVNSSSLYRHIDKHAQDFDLFIFAPYLFGTTFWGGLIHPERSVLIPCLHNEANAYLDITKSLFAQVKGCIFNTDAEKTLAHTIYGEDVKGKVVGMTIELDDFISKKPYFDDEFSYLLYLGRMETGKNLHILVDHFVSAKEQSLIPDEIKLVIAGGGSKEDITRDKALLREDIFVTGRVSEEEKECLLQHALCLVQPSLNESFCIVMMEAWAQKTPALVPEACEVTRDHILAANGGVCYESVADFSASIERLYESSKIANQMGENGRRYVEKTYSSSAVKKRLLVAINDLITAPLASNSSTSAFPLEN